jgi:hypothetical protein
VYAIVGSTRLRFGKNTLDALRRSQCVVAKTFAFATRWQRAVNHELPATRVKTTKHERGRAKIDGMDRALKWCGCNGDKQMT